MIRPQRGARLGRQALPVFADSALLLLAAARFKEVCGGTSEVMDISLISRIGY